MMQSTKSISKCWNVCLFLEQPSMDKSWLCQLAQKSRFLWKDWAIKEILTISEVLLLKYATFEGGLKKNQGQNKYTFYGTWDI